MPRPRYLLCGGRDYDDEDRVKIELRKLPRDSILVEGDARGADSAVEYAADQLNMREGYNFWVWRCPADWTGLGKAAGPARNEEMLRETFPNSGIAFPGGRGTDDMVGRMEEGGLRVIRIASDE
jgi:hypothetical protein